MTLSADGAPTILVVEDNSDLLHLLSALLSEQRYEVRTARDGETGLTLALTTDPDLIILDIGLPRRSGLDVAREIRSRGITAPVLILTALRGTTETVSGLEAGADDYLAKPFANEELIARVRALLRRTAMHAEEGVLRVGSLVLERAARRVTRGQRTVSLTQKEFALLEFLMRNAGQTMTREVIMERVWQQPVDSASNIVDVYITYLRKKLQEPGETAILHTVRGVGYLLEP